MCKTSAMVGAVIASVAFVSTAVADVGVSVTWTFDGTPGAVHNLLPGETVTIGLEASWFDTDGIAMAFGALVGVNIDITGDTGTNELDTVSNLMRVPPFDFGPSSLDGTLTSNTDNFSITGVGPSQNQFDDSDWIFGSPTGVVWQFEFMAGPQVGRSVMLDIESLDGALLFIAPFEEAIDVLPNQIVTSEAFINVVPTPGMLPILGIAGLIHFRRKR